MVNLAEIQAAYYMVAATGVLVAAIYYLFSIRETKRNRRINTTAALLQSMLSREMMRIEGGLMEMELKDFDDFYKKI